MLPLVQIQETHTSSSERFCYKDEDISVDSIGGGRAFAARIPTQFVSTGTPTTQKTFAYHVEGRVEEAALLDESGTVVATFAYGPEALLGMPIMDLGPQLALPDPTTGE